MFNSDPSIFSNPWYSRMFRDIDFWQRWIDRWQELRTKEFALTNLHGLVDSLANQVRESERREAARWPGFTAPRTGSYQGEVDRMKNWLSNRVSFIDTNFLAAPVLNVPGGPVTADSTVALSGPPVAGEYSGSLDNVGKRVTLQGPLQEPILDFTYDNGWYPATDGAGFSLVAEDENAAPGPRSDPLDWRVSSALGGSPGRVDSAPPSFPPVLINEALTHTDPPERDAVELFNPTAAPADIGGWFLTDDRREPKKFPIPAGTSIPAGGFKVFDATQFDSGPNAFNLSSLGEDVYLFSGNGTDLTGYAHGFSYGTAAHGVSFGRYLDSIGEERFVAQAQATLGQPIAGPRIGPVVISEIMAHPPPIGMTNNLRDEHIELVNITPNSIPLFDPAAPTNTWRLAGGVELPFPGNLTLAPNQALLAVNFDPKADGNSLAAFATRYGLSPSSVLIIGPYKGNLDNKSDRISLFRPDVPEPAQSMHPGLVPYVLVDEVHYQNQAPWPTGASGTSQSLQPLINSAYADDPANWQVSAPSPGTVLKIDAIQLQGGVLTLQFQAAAGKSYSVLYRDSLAVGSWKKLTDLPTGNASGPTQATDSAMGGTPSRYYRVVTPALP